MRRISRITVAGAATASLALALSACGGTSTSSSCRLPLKIVFIGDTSFAHVTIEHRCATSPSLIVPRKGSLSMPNEPSNGRLSH